MPWRFARTALVALGLCCVTGAAHAEGAQSQAWIEADSGAEPTVRCGTRWLATERAAGRLGLPAAHRPTAPTGLAQVGAPIAVGTQLHFPVSGSAFLIPATCQRVGPRSYVFVEDSQWDENGGSVLQSHVDALGELFDVSTPADPGRGVYDLTVSAFGEPPDVDGHERIFLLVLDIGNPFVVGFFDAAVADHDVPELRRDVLYLSQFHLRRRDYLARGTLAHEFQHLIHWRWDRDEDPWVDEGLSGYAEELTGYPEADPDAVPEFLKRPDTSLIDWPVNDPARSYGVTYLFMSYLAERFGEELLGAIVAEPRNGVAGVDDALADVGVDGDFADVWARWTVGNYAASDERYAYGALGARRVTTFDFDTLPLDLKGNVSGRWATTNVLLRTPGSVALDFDGGDGAGFRVWTYAMGDGQADLIQVILGDGNRGHVEVADIDSLVLIVGRTSAPSGDFEISVRASTPTVVFGGQGATPLRTALADAYPNPFNATVHIPYVVRDAGAMRLDIFGLTGQRVRRLADGPHLPGSYEVAWDGRDEDGKAVASGVYLLSLHESGQLHTARVALIR